MLMQRVQTGTLPIHQFDSLPHFRPFGSPFGTAKAEQFAVNAEYVVITSIISEDVIQPQYPDGIPMI